MKPSLLMLFDLRSIQSSTNADEPGFNDIGLSGISIIASDIPWYWLIPLC